MRSKVGKNYTPPDVGITRNCGSPTHSVREPPKTFSPVTPRRRNSISQRYSSNVPPASKKKSRNVVIFLIHSPIIIIIKPTNRDNFIANVRHLILSSSSYICEVYSNNTITHFRTDKVKKMFSKITARIKRNRFSTSVY